MGCGCARRRRKIKEWWAKRKDNRQARKNSLPVEKIVREKVGGCCGGN